MFSRHIGLRLSGRIRQSGRKCFYFSRVVYHFLLLREVIKQRKYTELIMATNSRIVTDKDLADMRQHIETLKELRQEIVLANNAGITLNYTVKDIDDQIAGLETIIRAYTPR